MYPETVHTQAARTVPSMQPLRLFIYARSPLRLPPNAPAPRRLPRPLRQRPAPRRPTPPGSSRLQSSSSRRRLAGCSPFLAAAAPAAPALCADCRPPRRRSHATHPAPPSQPALLAAPRCPAARSTPRSAATDQTLPRRCSVRAHTKPASRSPRIAVLVTRSGAVTHFRLARLTHGGLSFLLTLSLLFVCG